MPNIYQEISRYTSKPISGQLALADTPKLAKITRTVTGCLNDSLPSSDDGADGLTVYLQARTDDHLNSQYDRRINHQLVADLAQRVTETANTQFAIQGISESLAQAMKLRSHYLLDDGFQAVAEAYYLQQAVLDQTATPTVRPSDLGRQVFDDDDYFRRLLAGANRRQSDRLKDTDPQYHELEQALAQVADSVICQFKTETEQEYRDSGQMFSRPGSGPGQLSIDPRTL